MTGARTGRTSRRKADSRRAENRAEYAAVLHIIEEITGYTKAGYYCKSKRTVPIYFGGWLVRFLEAGDDDYFGTYIRDEFINPDDEFKIMRMIIICGEIAPVW